MTEAVSEFLVRLTICISGGSGGVAAAEVRLFFEHFPHGIDHDASNRDNSQASSRADFATESLSRVSSRSRPGWMPTTFVTAPLRAAR
jgi:hypothetical protein